jgi:hypothetical protein
LNQFLIGGNFGLKWRSFFKIIKCYGLIRLEALFLEVKFLHVIIGKIEIED